MIYDPATDRLFWTDFNEPNSVRYYVLGETPLGYTGLGTAFGSYGEPGTYGMLLDGGFLYRLRSVIDVVDADTGDVLHSVPTDGSHTSWGHGNVAKFGDYLLFTDQYFVPMNLSVLDVSTPTQASQVAILELSNSSSPVTSGFALRPNASLAIVADSTSGLHIIDLSELPDTVSRIQLLGPDELGGLVPAGKVDCTPDCCYADCTTGELIVLCP